MPHHARKELKCTHHTQAASYHPKPPASRAPSMTDPGAFGVIGVEYYIVPAPALSITATAACLITAIPREQIALSLSVGAGTSLHFGLDGYHVVAALEDGWGACGLRGPRFPSPLLLGSNQRGMCAGMAPRAARRSTIVADNFVQSNSRPFPIALGALCTGICVVR